MVPEAKEDYCDVSGATTNLAFVGEDPGTRIQVSPDSSRLDLT